MEEKMKHFEKRYFFFKFAKVISPSRFLCDFKSVFCLDWKMLENVEIRNTKEAGRGLYSTKNFETGMNILNSTPYVHTLGTF